MHDGLAPSVVDAINQVQAKAYKQAEHYLTAWLMDNNIIRKSAIPSEGYVAINCNTGKPFTFQYLGEHDGNNQ